MRADFPWLLIVKRSHFRIWNILHLLWKKLWNEDINATQGFQDLQFWQRRDLKVPNKIIPTHRDTLFNISLLTALAQSKPQFFIFSLINELSVLTIFTLCSERLRNVFFLFLKARWTRHPPRENPVTNLPFFQPAQKPVSTAQQPVLKQSWRVM